jgi:hypothetical protein
MRDSFTSGTRPALYRDTPKTQKAITKRVIVAHLLDRFNLLLSPNQTGATMLRDLEEVRKRIYGPCNVAHNKFRLRRFIAFGCLILAR